MPGSKKMDTKHKLVFHLSLMISHYNDRHREYPMTYDRLSEKTGISTNTISRIVNGKTTMTSHLVIVKLCEALECDLGDLVTTELIDT